MIPRVQSHIFRQISQSVFDFIQYFRHGRYVVDVGWFYMDVDDHVVFAVYRSVLTVVKTIRLPVSVLLPRSRICPAFRLLLPSAARWIVIIVIVVERLLAQYLPIQVHLLLQFFQIRFRCLLHSYLVVE